MDFLTLISAYLFIAEDQPRTLGAAKFYIMNDKYKGMNKIRAGKKLFYKSLLTEVYGRNCKKLKRILKTKPCEKYLSPSFLE